MPGYLLELQAEGRLRHLFTDPTPGDPLRRAGSSNFVDVPRTRRNQMRRKTTILILGILGLLAASDAQGQVYSITPTYQASFHEWSPDLVNSTFRAWGIMAGLDRGIHRWSPHFWFQRYELGDVCEGSLPDGKDCRIEGWEISVGPRIQLAQTDLIGAALVPTVGLDTRATSQFAGGAGLHVDVKVGAFRPQLLSRVQVIRGRTYGTFGVGVSFQFGSIREGGETEPWGG